MSSYITRSCRQFISITTLCGMGRSPSANKRFLTSSEGYGYSNSGTQIAETSMWLPFLLYSIAILSDILSDKKPLRRAAFSIDNGIWSRRLDLHQLTPAPMLAARMLMPSSRHFYYNKKTTSGRSFAGR